MTMQFRRDRFRSAAEVVTGVIAEALRPSPPVDLVAWTEKNIIFGPNDPYPGHYSFEKFPFFRRILDCLSPEHPARTVALRKSAQIGGTVLGDAFLLGWLDLVPTQLMCVQPSLPQARSWVNNKVKPAVRQSPGLKAILSFDNPKDVKATELLFERLDARGGVIVTGANSPASLSQHSVKAQLQDDLAKWEDNDAGDPETQADSRSIAFEAAKIFKVSTPMIEGECRIDRAFRRGTQEHYEILCPHCGHSHPLEWENMRRNIETAGGVEGAFFNCPECGGIIEEKHREQLVRPENGARWVAQNPGGSYPSFHLWAAYAPLTSWPRIAASYLDAQGDPAKEQTFANDSVGLPWRRPGEAPEWEGLRDRAMAGDFRRGQVAQGYYFLLAGADVQADRVEIGVWAFGPENRRQAVDHIVIDGRIADAETREELDRVLTEQRWPDAYGNLRGLSHLMIDCGYERLQVLDWAGRHRASLVTPIVGATSDAAPILGSPQTGVRTAGGRRQGKRRGERLVVPVGGSAIKGYIYADLRKVDPLVRGFMALPQGFDDHWFEQLTAERRARGRNRRGFPVWTWELPSGRRNEVLDCAVYAYAAAVKLGWKKLTEAQWAQIAAEQDRPPDQPMRDLFTVDQADVVRPLATPAAAPSAPANPKPPAGGGFFAGNEDYWSR